MKIQLYSDLHIEFEEFDASVDEADVVVFAGDIEVGKKGMTWLKALKTDKPLIYVLGNHEYYRNVYPKLLSKLKEDASGANIHLLENESLAIDGVTFHGCTLWTDFELLGNPAVAGYECQQVMNDFRKIRKLPGYSKIRAIDVSLIHKRSLKWLTESLVGSTTVLNVVVTHHAPSLRSVPDKYKEDIVTSAYASNLEGFIAECSPDLWLHGHLHNSSDYQISSCRVICNPRGYRGELNSDFEIRKIVEVG